MMGEFDNGGLGNIVQQKVDAYRGQPEKLQQSYQQNQQLIDLLALQKLKSEKEAAARAMQMQQQQNPQTIAQQREQELMAMTKNEMAQQQGALMKQQAAQAQKQMAPRPQAPQQAVRPQGIASVPAPNMQKLANGGVVGFAAGGDVKQKVAEAKRRIAAGEPKSQIEASLGITITGGNINVDGQVFPIREVSATKPDELDKTPLDGMGETPEVDYETMVESDAEYGRNMYTDRPIKPQTKLPGVGAVEDDFPIPYDDIGNEPGLYVDSGGDERVPGPAPMKPKASPDAAVDEQLGVNAPRDIDTSRMVGGSASISSGLTPVEGDWGMADKTADWYGDRAGYSPEERASMETMQGEKQALYDEINDPKQAKWDRLFATLGAAGGTRDPGAMFRNMTATSQQMKDKQSGSRLKGLEAIQEMKQGVIDKDQEVRGLGAKEGLGMYRHDQNARLQQQANEVAAQANTVLKQQANDAKVAQAMQAVAGKMTQIREAAVEETASRFNMSMMQVQQDMLSEDPDVREKAIAVMDEIEQYTADKLNSGMYAKLNTLYDQLQSRLTGLDLGGFSVVNVKQPAQ